MNVVDEVKSILSTTLSLGARGAELTESTTLIGGIPEFDSMAVVSVIGALEDHFGIGVADDEINADTFASVGSLAAFVSSKLASA